MSNDRHTVAGQWGVQWTLLALCILFFVSCAHKETLVGPKQAQVPTAPRAVAEETAPGSKVYLALVQQRIRDVWKAPALDFANRTYATVVQFRLHKNGSVSRVRIEQSSGNESYDAAGKQAVLSASPLPAFPPDLSHAYVDAHITLTAPSEKE
ncbi:MAG TPA: energy transducer TonB [Nitrospira sp.]|nr:energy transducer TonB [Nitrospira sp.]